MDKMNLVSLRVITADIRRLVRFYEDVTGTAAIWATDEFAELKFDSFNLAIGSTKTLSFFGTGVAEAANNKTVIIEFLVRDVDNSYQRIRELTNKIVQQPTTMPWGNRSLLFRDPDDNLVNFFTPVSDQAKLKYQ